MTFLCSLLVACGSRGILLAACGSGDIEGDADLDEPVGDMGGDTTGETGGDVGEEAGPDVSYDIPFEDTSWWECREDGDCTDDDPCTRNTCDPETHSCTSEPVTGLQLDEPAILLSEGPYYLGWPYVVWTGSEVGMTWRDGRDAGCADPWGTTFCAQETYFNKVTPDWTTLPSDVRLSSSDALSSPTSIVWTGSEFVIAWNDRGRGMHEAYITRVDSGGTEVDTESRAIGWESAGYPYLAWTGTEIVAIWSGVSGTSEATITTTLTRFDTDLAEIGAAHLSDDGSWEYGIAWTGSEIATLWFEREPQVRRFSPVGDAVGTPTALDTRYPVGMLIIWTGSEIATLWHGNLVSDDPCLDALPGCQNVFLARMDTEGTLLGELTDISHNDGSSRITGASWTGSELGVTWYDSTGRDYEGHLTRVTPDGAIIAEAPIPRPSTLVWTGSEYMLAWNEESEDGFSILMSRTVLCE